MLDCLAVPSLLLPKVWLKFVLELRLGCLAEFLLWSANIVLFDLSSRPLFPRHAVSLRCAFFARPPSVPFSFRRTLLARLLVCPVSVASRVARPTSLRHVSVLWRVNRSPSHVFFVSLRVERIAFSAPLLFVSGTVCSTTFSALWAVCFTDRLQCAVFVVFCVGFNLRGFGFFGVCI